jgi:hypothetical protein
LMTLCRPPQEIFSPTLRNAGSAADLVLLGS